MKKIPTVFKRDPENMSRVLNEVNPAAAWVFEDAGKVRATRKFDGTCVRLCDGTEDGLGGWWARREVRAGKQLPPDYWPEETDPNTGKTVGWEPIGQSPFIKAFQEAAACGFPSEPGTYELCGPKINGNPEGFNQHYLIRHGSEIICYDVLSSFEEMREFLAGTPYEGIVWHHPDGRMAKLKRRDFGHG